MVNATPARTGGKLETAGPYIIQPIGAYSIFAALHFQRSQQRPNKRIVVCCPLPIAWTMFSGSVQHTNDLE